ncbi:uncharacterized protein LOC106673818 isoform X1 [Cimex lectularius]|uniref:F-box domain-containing protein n=1 Tax=Cimex lectularius TaxID=79782 RepID=A0A8I6SHP4_CIMLE|nr:uncharacterized protein LOC106673818 isoform X1 [Cimex lectularius]
MSFRFGDLPTELIYKIFSYLNSTDLARSCMVSKRWRSIGNSDTLWKHLCELDDIHEEYIDSKNIPSDGVGCLDPVCKWAFVYSHHMISLTRNWRTHSYSDTFVPSNVEQVKCHNLWMFQVLSDYQTLAVYELKDKVFKKLQSLQISNTKANIKYLYPIKRSLFLSFGNTIEIFKYVDGKFHLSKMIAITESGLKTNSNSMLLGDFLKQYHTCHVDISKIVLLDNYLWLSYGNDLLVVDLTNTIVLKTIKITSEEDTLVNNTNMFAVVSINTITIFFKQGELHRRINAYYKFKGAISINNNYIAFIDQDNSRPVVVGCSSGRLQVLNVSHSYCLALNRIHPYVYILHSNGTFYIFKAIHLVNGACLWSSDIHATVHLWHLRCLKLKIILNKFILILPYNNKLDNYAVYRLSDGKYCYCGDNLMPLQVDNDKFLIYPCSRFLRKKCGIEYIVKSLL